MQQLYSLTLISTNGVPEMPTKPKLENGLISDQDGGVGRRGKKEE